MVHFDAAKKTPQLKKVALYYGRGNLKPDRFTVLITLTPIMIEGLRFIVSTRRLNKCYP